MSTVHQHDVMVVGAGPAGATAARALAAAGLRTLVLDRDTFPRAKPCGGAVTVRALGRFPYLRAALPSIATHWISRLHLEGPDRTPVELVSSEPAVLMVRRIEFDALLVSLARRAGADVLEGADVRDVTEHADGVSVVTRDGRQFRAARAVAADGVHGVVARRLGLAGPWNRAGLAVDLMEEAPAARLAATDPGALWVSYGFPAALASGPATLSDGYAYVFPKAGHVNVGIGYLSSAYRATPPTSPYALQRGLVEFLVREGVLRGASTRACFTPFVIPVGGPLRRTGTRRVLVAGDAGGFVNGFSAEGIYYAMVSGALAADAVIGATRRRADLARTYQAQWEHEIGAELRDSVALQRYLFGEPQRVVEMVHGAQGERAARHDVVRWASGELPYVALRRRLLARHPVAALFLAGALLTSRRDPTDWPSASLPES